MPPALGRPLTMLADGAYILRRAQESYHGQRRSRNPQPVVLSAVWRSLVAMVNRYRPSRLMVFFEGDAQVQASPQQAVPEFRLMPAFSPEERMDAHRLKRQPQRTTADKPMLPLLDRKSLVPGYKSNRNTVPPFAHWKIDGGASALARHMWTLLRYMGFPTLIAPGEADDAIAASTMKIRATTSDSVAILSRDRDFYQLLKDPGVFVTENVNVRRYSSDDFIEDYAFKPEFYADYLALKGDGGDCVPGIKGIGDKRAKDLVRQYGNIENMLASQAADKTLQRLKDDETNLRLYRKAVSFDGIEPLLDQVVLPSMDFRPPQEQELLSLLEEYNIQLWREKFNELFGTSLPFQKA